jgi:hypothetical protein
MLSNATTALIQKAKTLWQAHFRKNSPSIADTLMLDDMKPDGIEAAILALELARITEKTASQCTFTLKEILDNTEEIQTKTEAFKTIQAAANTPEIQTLLKQCRETLLATAATFGIQKEIEPVLENHHLGRLLHTANHEFKHLLVHQYTQGTGKHGKFHLNGWIYAFPTMHELVCALARQPIDGLTLCIIIDPDIIEYSIFAWALKTGDTLTILSQDNGLSHQNQKFLRRNPGHDFENRANNCFYPYSIFTYKKIPTAGGTNSQTHITGMFIEGKPPGGNNLTSPGTTLHKVKPLKDLEPEEIVWLLLIADLIHHEYWQQEKKTNETAYTGEMVENPSIIPQLLTAAPGGQLLLENPGEQAKPATAIEYKPIILNNLNNETIRETGENKNNWEEVRTGNNDWMIQRYEQQSDIHLYLPAQTAPGETKNSDHQLKPFNPTGLYGTKTKIEKERFYIARTNQAGIIQKRADQEFKNRAPEIITWFQNQIRQNIETLKRAAATGELIIPAQLPKPDCTDTVANCNILQLYIHGVHDPKTHPYPWSYQILANCHGGITEKGNHLCIEDTQHTGKCRALFEPTNTDSLALLTGIKIGELPDVLQHWGKPRQHTGNPILNLIDPIETLKNPWDQLKFRIQLHFTRHTLNRWTKGKFQNQTPFKIEQHSNSQFWKA